MIIPAVIIVAAFLAWKTAIATLPTIMIWAGIVGLAYSLVAPFIAGDTGKNGDSGVSWLFLVATVCSIFGGIIWAVLT